MMTDFLMWLFRLVPSLATHVFLPLLGLAFVFGVFKTTYRLLGVIKND